MRGFSRSWDMFARPARAVTVRVMTKVNMGAAFFDLDRTLLTGASGAVFSHAMRDAGLLTRSVPGEAALY